MNRGEELVYQRVLTGHAKLVFLEGKVGIRWYNFRWRKWITKSETYNRDRAKYYFARTSVYKNRAVWIIHNRKRIPPGYHIDHIDLDKTNDHPDNLKIQLMEESHRQGQMLQEDKTLRDLCDWFTLQSYLSGKTFWNSSQ